ncbi:RNA helicase [Lithospermum erythrorhizon]|uniref:DNA helicase n=1 Tax=Lithospermum erythrorhizon TaxID=34254 RepID=A0AAV3P9G4_LITER
MPPKKRASSGSTKKSTNKDNHHNQHQHSQPTKFGIQHFFEKHTQNSNSHKPKTPQNPNSHALSNNGNNKNCFVGFVSGSKNRMEIEKSCKLGEISENGSSFGVVNGGLEDSGIKNRTEIRKSCNSGEICPNGSSVGVVNGCLEGSGIENRMGSGTSFEVGEICANGSSDGVVDDGLEESRKNGGNLRREGEREAKSPEITPIENQVPGVVVVDGDKDEASPDVFKAVSVKRVKFSPGMLIKQSQDDGGDEVSWKISPINERLQAMSKRKPNHSVDMIKILADSSRFNSMNFQQCSKKKTSPVPAGKLEKWISSPLSNMAKKSSARLNKISSSKVCSEDAASHLEINEDLKNRATNKGSTNSTYTTPCSVSSFYDESSYKDVTGGAPEDLGLRRHNKALIELLDQVETVISGEESGRHDINVGSSGERTTASYPQLEEEHLYAESKIDKDALNINFLVLEVTEKQGFIGSSGSKSSFKHIRLLNEKCGEERSVQLWDEWFYSIVSPGDTVHVLGEFDDEGECDINHNKNFLIVHPDILVSGTRVAGSFSCPRRAVLDERLKSNEHSIAALTGTLLHQIFQAGLVKDIVSKEFMEEYARIVLHKNLESLYACGVDENVTYKILIEAIPKLLNWIYVFRDSQGCRTQGIDFGSDKGLKGVHISEVVDIEEMAWAPKYGLKGMVDASLRIQAESSCGEITEKMMPLEFKTGKATRGQSSMEHSAQVMLYTLLMSERYKETIDCGLLYYLQTDQTQGISVKRSDIIGLIMRRNELANDLFKATTLQQLPPMLQSANMCRGCRHLNVCSIYHKAYGGSTESSGLGNLFDSLVHHLSNTHTSFLKNWDRLIDLEAHATEIVKKEIFSFQSSRTDRQSAFLSALMIDPSVKFSERNLYSGNQFVYRFVRQDTGKQNRSSMRSLPLPMKDLDSKFKRGDYVILSTEPGRLPIANGSITDFSFSYITVSFPRRLRLPGSKSASILQDLESQVWRIDKDEIMSSFALMRFNLIQLFLQNEQSSHLRKMIVDLEVPRFDSGCVFSQDPASSYIWSEKSLNDDQRRAIFKILAAQDYTLILGMPGTGKTSTMVHAVKALLVRGSSILLTSYTNTAVDNLLIKLKAQGIDFIRIGRYEAVHEEVRGNCLSEMDLRGTEDIKQKMDHIKVVAVTCLGVTSPLLTNKTFDVCIMDEAGQTTLPVSLGPLTLASKFVLVGDHYQLPPLVQSTEAKENGMAVSLFCRLSEAHPQAISALRSQYRMCAPIMELSNALIYGNRLRCGSSDIANAKLQYKCVTSAPSWLKEVLNPDRPVVFINTDMLPAYEAIDLKAINNPTEAHIIAEITNTLTQRGIEEQNIGIIAPYNSQANLIRAVITKSVEIHTIDKYQGRDKDCILVSFVRSNENSKSCLSSLLGDWHRINVAITRAKKKLIMVGSCRTLSRVPLLKLLIEKVDEQTSILSVSKKDLDQKMELKRCSQIR